MAIDLLVDQQSCRVGLSDDGEVIGAGIVVSSRIIDALSVGVSVIFGGEYLTDTMGSFVADADGFMLGFIPVMVNRMV